MKEKLEFLVKKENENGTLYGKVAELAIKEGIASQKETDDLLDSI